MGSKRYWLIRLLFVFLIGFVYIAGCSPNEKDISQQGSSTEKDALQQGEGQGNEKDFTLELTIAMASPGGVWQAICEGAAQAIRQEYPGSRIEVISGSMGGNAVSVQEKTVSFALSHAPNARLAINGSPPYDSKNPDIMGLSAVYIGPLHFLVPVDSPIYSFKDIKENKYPVKMSINSKGSTVEFLSEAVFKQNGITIDDIKSWGGEISYLSTADGFSYLREKVYNMGTLCSYLPSTQVLELSSGLDIRLISLEEDTIDNICKNYGTVRSVIPGGVYSFQNEETITVGSPNIFITNKDMPDEVAYKIVEALDKQRDYLGNVHETFKTLTLEKMFKDMGDIPVHPGALKYYQEHGVVN